MKGNYEDYSDEEDVPLSLATKKVFSRKKSNQNKTAKAKESSASRKKAKTKNTNPAQLGIIFLVLIHLMTIK